MLSIRNLLTGGLERLRYVNRYSTNRVTHLENVAEHSFYCAFYAFSIATWVVKYKPHLELDMELVLTRALLHDVEEAATGDVPRSFKYSTLVLQDIMRTASSIGCQQILSPLWEDASITHLWKEHWNNAKDNTIEGKVLEFADFLSALAYIWQELDTGNTFFLEHMEVTHTYFKMFKEDGYRFLSPLIEQAEKIIEEIVDYDYSRKGKLHSESASSSVR